MIILVGFMGAGKSTIGRLLAERLGMPFVDIDEFIKAQEHRSISQIFEEGGEEGFRQLERQAILENLVGDDAVIALGGGAVESPATREALDSAFVVYLEIDFDEAVLRVGDDSDRPVISNPNIRDIYLRRLPLYEGVADYAIPTAKRSPEEIVEAILSRIENLS